MKHSFFLAAFFLVVNGLYAQNIPDGYYDGTADLRGEELKQKLHQIIRNHNVRAYSEFRDTILPDLDEDPDNADNLIVFYKNFSVPKSDFAVDSDSWNREHTWPSSHGFPDTSDTTYTDAHNLRPSDASVNTNKSNKDFDNVENVPANEEGEAPDTYTDSDFWDPRDEIKGDVARILFYMDTRYNSDRLDLKIVDRESFSGDPEIGVLYTLIEWHEQDPVDQAEIDRHEGVYGYQGNRNPFVDHPEWVEEIFGSGTNPTIIANELSFSRDFGNVEAGSSLTQQYSVNVYNHASDISIKTTSPFSLSTDGNNFADSIGFVDDGSGAQTASVFIRFSPTDEGSFENDVTHIVDGDTLTFDVTGAEGEQEVLSIADARLESLGEVVSIAGVVIDEGNNSDNNRVVFDGTAGIVVRSFDAGNESANFSLGDSIQVTGGLGDFNNLLQISESPITISLLKSNAALPIPDTLLIEEVGESYESELIVVENVRFQSAGGTFAGGGSAGNFIVEDENGEELIFRLGADDHPLVGTTIPEGIYTITGIVGQFGSDYQLSPRSEDDVVFISDGNSTPDLVSIAQARAISLGERVQITGVVIDKGNNSTANRIIYDGTAGIVVRSFDQDNESSSLVQGDSVLIIGGLSDFNGALQIEESPIIIELIKQGVQIDAPQQVGILEVSEAYESELIEISDLTFSSTGVFERGNYTVTDGTNDLTLRIGLSTHPLVGTDIPEGTVKVTGFVGQFEDEYQLFPRDVADIVITSDPPLSALDTKAFIGIYPNPTSSVIRFKLPDSLPNKVVEGVITNADGRSVKSFSSLDGYLNIEDLSAGVYFLKIEVEEIVYHFKFFKQ